MSSWLKIEDGAMSCCILCVSKGTNALKNGEVVECRMCKQKWEQIGGEVKRAASISTVDNDE